MLEDKLHIFIINKIKICTKNSRTYFKEFFKLVPSVLLVSTEDTSKTEVTMTPAKSKAPFKKPKIGFFKLVLSVLPF